MPAGETTPAAGPADDDDDDDDERGQRGRILLVEGEAGLRAMTSRILARNGYQVLLADGGASAIALARDPGQRISLLITDMVMPGMLGTKVVDRVRAIRPELPAVFITGYAQQVLDFHGIEAPGLDIVQKPYTEATLLTRVRQALGRPPVPRPPGAPRSRR
jgi:DNA-binding response OmpR family regulator